jgi:hypothetical protein
MYVLLRTFVVFCRELSQAINERSLNTNKRMFVDVIHDMKPLK